MNLNGFPGFEGEVRWVGPSAEYLEGLDPEGPTFVAAQLQCDPFFQDWTSIGVIQKLGAAFVDQLHIVG